MSLTTTSRVTVGAHAVPCLQMNIFAQRMQRSSRFSTVVDIAVEN